MPIPLLFIGAAAATGVFGVGKTLKAGIDNSTAKDINRTANRMIEDAKEELERARTACGVSLEKLGEQKLFILDKSINTFVASYEKLKNVDFQGSKGLEEINKIRMDKKMFSELKEMGSFAASFMGGALAGGVGGAMAAFGAYGAATKFAAASTGTAIASLSGATATNATLAFLGEVRWRPEVLEWPEEPPC